MFFTLLDEFKDHLLGFALSILAVIISVFETKRRVSRTQVILHHDQKEMSSLDLVLHEREEFIARNESLQQLLEKERQKALYHAQVAMQLMSETARQKLEIKLLREDFDNAKQRITNMIIKGRSGSFEATKSDIYSGMK